MKLRPFELALVVVFIGLAFLALVLISTYKAAPDKDVVLIGPVTIWGTLPAEPIDRILYELADADDSYREVTYKYVSPDSLANAVTNAIADGVGPDILLYSQENLVELRKRINPIAYTSLPLPDIKNYYVDGAQVFALSDGMYAYPVAVDPIVMYWNRDLLATKGFLSPPVTWEELVNNQFPNLIERNFDRTITRSVVAMGEYGNVRNSFGVISTLLMQGGTRAVTEKDGEYAIRLNESIDGTSRPLTSVADFYTRFSRPSNSLYSWNRSFIEDRSRFVGGDLILYFGYGSESSELEQLNPNLNFDIAEMPQGAAATVRRTYAQFYGFSLLRSSDNKGGASAMIAVLASATNGPRIAVANHMAPAYRNSVASGSNDTYGRIIYRSAGIAFGWLNPSRRAVDTIFTTMTRDVNENRFDESKAAQDTIERLELEYN